MELTDNDKQRIDDAADSYGFQVPYDGTNEFYEHGKVKGFQAGAEYATLYERQQQEKLQAFKDYVHGRLDDMGIPVDPESPHKLAGCRVGGRLDFIENERMESRDKVRKLEAERTKLMEIVKIVDELVCTNEFKKVWPATSEVLIKMFKLH